MHFMKTGKSLSEPKEEFWEYFVDTCYIHSAISKSLKDPDILMKENFRNEWLLKHSQVLNEMISSNIKGFLVFFLSKCQLFSRRLGVITANTQKFRTLLLITIFVG